MSDVYYDPASYGLTVVGQIDRSDGCYCFDLFLVWRDIITGSLFFAEDGGCSCPSPFEGIGRDDMQTGSPHEVAEAAQAFLYGAGNYRKDEDDQPEYGVMECADLIAKLMTGDQV